MHKALHYSLERQRRLRPSPLLFHTNGILVGHHPDFIAMYASKFSADPSLDRIIVVNQKKALEEILQNLHYALE